MAVFEVDTYVVAQSLLDKHEKVVKRIFDYGQRHLDISKYVKSLRLFRQGVGGDPVGKVVLITEFASLSEMEKFYYLLSKDADWLKIKKQWKSVIDLKTMHVSLWKDQLRDLWVEDSESPSGRQ